jgi:ribose/xylose/arabinose/galactoside ABC-type transport system permease subunit
MTVQGSSTSAPASAPSESGPKFDPIKIAQQFGLYVVLVVMVIVATIVYPGFLDWGNIKLVLSQNAPLGIVAVGMTLVIIGGGFDISVGAIFAVGGTTAAMVAGSHGVVEAFIAGTLTGLVCGLVNAIVITRFKVNPFIATLGSASLFSGTILLISNSSPHYVEKAGFTWLGQHKVAGIQVSMLVMIAFFIIGWIILNRSVFGRRVQAVGGNAEAARLAGVRTDLVQGGTYVITGLLAAFAGVISVSQLGVGQGTAGSPIALESIAVVIIGGAALTGGEGSMARTAVGLAILATLDNIFFSLAVDNNWQLLSQGAIVIGAVALDQWLRRRSA